MADVATYTTLVPGVSIRVSGSDAVLDVGGPEYKTAIPMNFVELKALVDTMKEAFAYAEANHG
jgi:hypothetical protein